ncbi:MFS transporter [Kineosporia babensis]|uniref:MFS transporter n=1 Tax=Kineosporia babensis TaxID=499548 RepID=A0A9X1NG27_9ACTN|nr:MFS transporter [Kineosporia babensis]MCD5314462.1 MFS transporter [Kineosporia babensis]
MTEKPTQTAAADDPADALEQARRHTVDEDAGRLVNASRARLVAVMVSIILLTEVVPLQIGMTSIILPDLGLAFGQSAGNLSWAVSVTGLIGGATIALIGKSGDLWGKKRLLLTCAGLFIVGSLLCAVTTSWPVFLAGRGLESVALGMTVINYGLVRDLLPRTWIPVAVGFIGTGLAVAGLLGPILCGALTDAFSWRSVYWFMFIYMIVTAVVLFFVVPESPVRVRDRLDVVGAALFGTGVAGVLVYLSRGSTWGWTDAAALAFLAGGLVLIVAFLAWEARVRVPMMPLTLLRSPQVLLVMCCIFLVTGAQSAIGVNTAFIFRTPEEPELRASILEPIAAQAGTSVDALGSSVRLEGAVSYGSGFSVMQLALLVTIWLSLFAVAFAPLGGYIARRYGARLPLLIGTASAALACGLWSVWHEHWQQQALIGILFGLGAGFFYAAWPNLIIDSVPAGLQGVSTGMVQSFSSIGLAAFTALLGSLLAAHPLRLISALPDGGEKVSEIASIHTQDAFTQSYLLLGALPCLIAFGIGLALRSGRTPARGGAHV